MLKQEVTWSFHVTKEHCQKMCKFSSDNCLYINEQNGNFYTGAEDFFTILMWIVSSMQLKHDEFWYPKNDDFLMDLHGSNKH